MQNDSSGPWRLRTGRVQTPLPQSPRKSPHREWSTVLKEREDLIESGGMRRTANASPRPDRVGLREAFGVRRIPPLSIRSPSTFSTDDCSRRMLL